MIESGATHRPPFFHQVHHTDRGSAARQGTFHTPHGSVSLPAFMPVGTAATVKGLTVEQLRSTGAQMLLANTYHLALRPGEDVIRDQGGLHGFMGWSGPILTDSGGFQLFSLAERVLVDDQGAHFRSHIDGSACTLTPESAIRIQQALGSDVAMVLDHVVALPSAPEVVRDAMRRTLQWAARSRAVEARADQVLFGIVQGGLDTAMRLQCAEQLASMDFGGYAVGGLSVGEPSGDMLRVLDDTVPALPADKPRYLMGVGRPQDLLEAMGRGIDLFDCVMPTRNGRNGLAFTAAGPLRLRNRRFERDDRPIEAGCPCPACRHSRSYLRHLFISHEMLGPVLLSAHNLTHYQRLLRDARDAISEDRFAAFRVERLAAYRSGRGQDDAVDLSAGPASSNP